MLLLFCVVAAAAFGFVVGRVWEMRQTMLRHSRLGTTSDVYISPKSRQLIASDRGPASAR